MNSDIMNAEKARRYGLFCGMRCAISGQFLHERRRVAAERGAPQKLRR